MHPYSSLSKSPLSIAGGWKVQTHRSARTCRSFAIQHIQVGPQKWLEPFNLGPVRSQRSLKIVELGKLALQILLLPPAAIFYSPRNPLEEGSAGVSGVNLYCCLWAAGRRLKALPSLQPSTAQPQADFAFST